MAENTLDIYTEGTTILLGAVLNSKAGKLKLNTGDFLFDNFHDVDQSSSSSFSVSVGTKVEKGPDGVFSRVLDLGASDASGSYAYRDKRGITYATIGLGEIVRRELFLTH